MDWFHWFIGGGPEALLTAIFLLVAVPTAIVVTLVNKIRGK